MLKLFLDPFDRCRMQWTGYDRLFCTVIYPFKKVRIKKNGAYYKLNNCNAEQGKMSSETRLESIFVNDIERLADNNLVRGGDNNVIESTGTFYFI